MAADAPVTALPDWPSPGGGVPASWGILDALDVAVLVLDGELRMVHANARWTESVGTAFVPGTCLTALIESATDSARPLRDTLRDGAPRSIELVVAGPHGEAEARRLSVTARRVAGGLVLQGAPDVDVAGDIRDVARRLSEAVDMAEVLRALCDIATRQCQATGAAVLRTTGKMGEVIAAAGDMLPAHGRSFELVGSLLAEALARETVVGEENFRESGRPLMRMMPELALGPILLAPLKAHGEALGVLAVARPAGGSAFSEREGERLRVLADHASLAVHKSLLLQQAQSADRAKGRFLATMSHELRTPLTALAGYGELLADQVIGPMSDPQLDILERMRSVTSHLSAMIEEILAFTSIEEGRETLRPSEYLVADLVRSAIAAVGPTAEQKGLALVVDLPAHPVRMTSDIDKVRQILVNLVGNAIKFTDRGTVTIGVAEVGPAVRMDVTDTGPGIATDELHRLFRPFVQLDSGLTRRHGGTGLGLYISRRLATLLGGHIEVSSTPGVGSTFTVVLPQSWETSA